MTKSIDHEKLFQKFRSIGESGSKDERVDVFYSNGVYCYCFTNDSKVVFRLIDEVGFSKYELDNFFASNGFPGSFSFSASKGLCVSVPEDVNEQQKRLFSLTILGLFANNLGSWLEAHFSITSGVSPNFDTISDLTLDDLKNVNFDNFYCSCKDCGFDVLGKVLSRRVSDDAIKGALVKLVTKEKYSEVKVSLDSINLAKFNLLAFLKREDVSTGIDMIHYFLYNWGCSSVTITDTDNDLIEVFFPDRCLPLISEYGCEPLSAITAFHNWIWQMYDFVDLKILYPIIVRDLEKFTSYESARKYSKELEEKYQVAGHSECLFMSLVDSSGGSETLLSELMSLFEADYQAVLNYRLYDETVFNGMISSCKAISLRDFLALNGLGEEGNRHV